MRSNTTRRVGSASVFITTVSCAAEVMAIYKQILMHLSTNPCAKPRRKLAGKCRELDTLRGEGEQTYARRKELYRRLPLRPGAVRVHHGSSDGDRMQLRDLHQERAALHLSLAEELSAPRRRGEPEGISFQQARHPPSALQGLRRRRVRARPEDRRDRGGGGECELYRRHRAGQAGDDADRREKPITLSRVDLSHRERSDCIARCNPGEGLHSLVGQRPSPELLRNSTSPRWGEVRQAAAIEPTTNPAPCSGGRCRPR